MSERPSDHVDWITSKADCELPQIFIDLESVLRADIDIADKRSPFRKNGNRYSFSFHQDANQYTIKRTPPSNSVGLKYRHVTLTLENDNIAIQQLEGFNDQKPDDQKLIGRVTKFWDKDTGECRLLLDEAPCVLWQISHAALNPLVF